MGGFGLGLWAAYRDAASRIGCCQEQNVAEDVATLD